MIRKKSLALMLASAVSVALAGSARAQFQTVINGHNNEANNRVGSGGSNDPVAPVLPPQGNYIVTGNVTGGAQFRGAVPYSSPTAFRGPTAGDISDNFIRQSTGVPINGVQQNNSQPGKPFFGVSNGAPPPSGYQIQNPSLGVTSSVQSPYQRAPGDMRLGAVGVSTTVLPQPGELLMPGPVDPTSHNSTYISASPLYGMRQLKPYQSSADQSIVNNDLGANDPSMAGVKMDPALVQKMRMELQTTSQAQQTQDAAISQNLDQSGVRPRDWNQTVPQPFNAPQNAPIQGTNLLKAQPLNTTQDVATGDLNTGAGFSQKLLTAPRQQSSQYAQLEDRLSQYKIVQQTTQAQSAQRFNQQVRAKQAADKAAADKTTAGVRNPTTLPTLPGSEMALPSGPAMPTAPAAQEPGTPSILPPASGAGTATPAAPVQRPAPLKINSLADGIQAKGLADVLRQAETLVKGGKYSSALEQYDLAEQVAPNNPLIMMGRANVELARTYYTAAERNLRDAYTANQALLMAQFDLKSLLGQDRLEAVVTDLKSIANREQKEATHVFLLAYIAYNTGNERQAAAYLDLAEKRSGGKDPLYPLVRKYWNLPADSTIDGLNNK